MSENAVVLINGNQYLVSPGQEFFVDGEDVTEPKVLLIWEDDKEVIVGKPYLDKYAVKIEKIKSEKSKKVTVLRFKAKSRYKKTKGHRQMETLIKVASILKHGA